MRNAGTRRILLAVLLTAVSALIGPAACRAQATDQALPGDVPDWAQQGAFHFIRIDGGQIESWKAERTWWGKAFSDDEKEVLGGIYTTYADRILDLLEQAGFNWIWVTWSNGWSTQAEMQNRKDLRTFMDKAHARGMHVTTYLSASNIFWESTLIDEPESATWFLIQNGRPVNYGGPDNPMRFIADVSNPDWRKYIVKKAALAVDAGADALFYDNIIGDSQGLSAILSLTQSMARFKADKSGASKVPLYANVHLEPDRQFLNDQCELIWNEYGKSTPGVWDDEDGWYVANARKTRFIFGSKQPWQPHKYEMDRYHCGPRETCYPDPAGQKTSIAEAWAFGSSLSRNIEGRFLRDLIRKEPAALAAWEAIAKYNRFTLAHGDVYRDVTPVARVGLLSRGGGAAAPGQVSEDRLADFLLRANVMFGFKILTRLDGGAALDGYDTLLVPGAVGELTPEDQAALKAFLDRGGSVKVLLSGNQAAQADAFPDRVAILPLSADEVRAINGGDPAPALVARIRNLPGARLATLDHSGYVVASVMKSQGQDKVFAHLVNYDHDAPADAVRVTLDMKLIFGKEQGCRVTLLSPDRGQPAVQSDPGACAFTIPRVEHYTIAEITPE